jgi:hypothetical protein
MRVFESSWISAYQVTLLAKEEINLYQLTVRGTRPINLRNSSRTLFDSGFSVQALKVPSSRCWCPQLLEAVFGRCFVVACLESAVSGPPSFVSFRCLACLFSLLVFCGSAATPPSGRLFFLCGLFLFSLTGQRLLIWLY